MRISKILTEQQDPDLGRINSECKDFILKSLGTPMTRYLSSHYDDIDKVKLRKQKKDTKFTETFNHAFKDYTHDLRQRALIANTTTNDPDTKQFYMFPINGFKYMYCTSVNNSSVQYQQVFETILDALEDEQAIDTFKDLLKFSYTSSCLAEGLRAKAEIIIYNIPYCYSVAVEKYPDYNELLFQITGKHYG